MKRKVLLSGMLLLFLAFVGFAANEGGIGNGAGNKGAIRAVLKNLTPEQKQQIREIFINLRKNVGEILREIFKLRRELRKKYFDPQAKLEDVLAINDKINDLNRKIIDLNWKARQDLLKIVKDPSVLPVLEKRFFRRGHKGFTFRDNSKGKGKNGF